MENIVVGVGDRTAQRTLEWVIRRAAQHAVRITLVRAFDMLASDPLEEQTLLERAGERIARGAPGAVVQLSLITAAVPVALRDAAEAADLLVLGTHRRNAIDSVLTGSIPLRVAAHSACATVIVPDDWKPGATQRVIVVGVSDDRTSDRAMLFAAREAQSAMAELETLHAWTVVVPTIASPDRVAAEPVQRAEQRAVLSRALDRIRAAYPRVRVRGVLEQRATATALGDRAAQGQLLVIGSHRRGPLAGLILGSTARDLLRSLKAPLCIVPPGVHDRSTEEAPSEVVAHAHHD